MAVFKNNPSVYQFNMSDNLAYNLRSWLNYGLSEAGACTQISRNLPTSGYTNLKRVIDERYPNGTVLEGFGPSWIWENDVSPNNPSSPIPFQVSGVYINNMLYAPGISGMIIDYENGRVIFPNNKISSNSSVQCEYTMRDIGVYTSDSSKWRTILDEYTKQFNQLQTLSPSGMAQILKDKRVWLPAVFIDIQNRDQTPLQLGGGEFYNFNIFFHVFSELPSLNKSIMDILTNQESKTLSLFNMNTSPIPLSYNGSLISGYKTYNQLSDRNGPYYWRSLYIEKTQSKIINSSFNLFRSEVRYRAIIEGYGFM